MKQHTLVENEPTLHNRFTWPLVVLLIAISICFLMTRFLGVYEQEVAVRIPDAESAELRLGAVSALVVSVLVNTAVMVFVPLLTGWLTYRAHVYCQRGSETKITAKSISAVIGIYIALRTIGWYVASIVGTPAKDVMEGYFDLDVSVVVLYLFVFVLLRKDQSSTSKQALLIPLISAATVSLALLLL